MRKSVAILLVPIGVILAIAVPIVVAVVWNIDPGKRPNLLVATMAPGVALLALAAKLWRSAAPLPAPEEIPPGYIVCDLCRKPVPALAGEYHRLDSVTPLARTGFVCSACARYRARRAITILVLFLAFLGVLAAAVAVFLPNGNKKRAAITPVGAVLEGRISR